MDYEGTLDFFLPTLNEIVWYCRRSQGNKGNKKEQSEIEPQILLLISSKLTQP